MDFQHADIQRVVASPLAQINFASVVLLVLVVAYISLSFTELSLFKGVYRSVYSFAKFAYCCFVKPHSTKGTGQQAALESFYRSQASIYDATRTKLLQGRETMLALVAAQLKHRQSTGHMEQRPIWVDIGGGTGWNIEQMQAHLDVPTFFHAVYLVDLSVSLCEVAEARFRRLGWQNVHVICQDARTFRLSEYEAGVGCGQRDFSIGRSVYDANAREVGGADLLTMSYSLSMIPEFHPAIDSVANLLAKNGILGVVDFYVQAQIDFQARNYIGSVAERHCMWISRVFWRTWFELDRVSLEPARRDYLEYKFGTILSISHRCRLFGFRIPYYVFVGCDRAASSSAFQLEALDAAATESPFISALEQHSRNSNPRQICQSTSSECRSKAYNTAIINLASSLPLPPAYYQNETNRIYYDDTLPKHRQFKNEYIYAFTWEDARVDARLLKITGDDVILAITSAGDNALSYCLERPKRVHVVDLNPTQNHLLELKIAAFRSLEYAELWQLFGEGKHPDFPKLLLEKLSPHLSSPAFDYWVHAGSNTFKPEGKGLYFSGGSGHALQLISLVGRFLGIHRDMSKICTAQTLNEQREIWATRVRRVLLSRLLGYFVIGSQRFMWKAFGVPSEQRNMIIKDYQQRLMDLGAKEGGLAQDRVSTTAGSGLAIWNYCAETLDPVVNTTLLSDDNHYYLLCLQGRASRFSIHYTSLTEGESRQVLAQMPSRIPVPSRARQALRSSLSRLIAHPHRRAVRSHRTHATRLSDHRGAHGQHGLVLAHWSRGRSADPRRQSCVESGRESTFEERWLGPLVHSYFRGEWIHLSKSRCEDLSGHLHGSSGELRLALSLCGGYRVFAHLTDGSLFPEHVCLDLAEQEDRRGRLMFVRPAAEDTNPSKSAHDGGKADANLVR